MLILGLFACTSNTRVEDVDVLRPLVPVVLDGSPPIVLPLPTARSNHKHLFQTSMKKSLNAYTKIDQTRRLSIIVVLITARKEVGARLCFYTCL